MILDSSRNNVTTSKSYLNLNTKHTLSLTIIKNTLLILENINQNMIFSDIFSFDNDKSQFYFNVNSKKKKDTKSKNISILNLAKIIKNNIIKAIRKYLLNKYKKYLCLKNVITKKKNKILSNYFKKFYAYKNNNITKSGIYHKINYNDDFNINKKINLYSKNNNVIYRNKNRNNKNLIQSSTNFRKTHKYWNKDFNITVHEIKDKDINNKKKNIISSYNKK